MSALLLNLCVEDDMMFDELPGLKIGQFEIKIPVIQGGMGIGISMANLATAVSNEGGLGVIAAVGAGRFEPDFIENNREANIRALRKEIRRAHSMTDKPIGVNIMVALTDFNNIVKASVEEGAEIIFMGAGLPLKMNQAVTVDQLREGKTRFVPIVSSARATRVIFNYWHQKFNCIPDAIVIEGPKAGGHLGFKLRDINDMNYTLENIIPDIFKVVRDFEQSYGKKVPIVAGGGLYTGSDIYRLIKTGIDGVQIATRLIGTEECDASLGFKKSVIDCKEEDIVIIESPVGLPGRAIRNKFIEEMMAGKKMPFECPWQCLKTCDFVNAPYCIAVALVNAEQGKMDKGFAFVGANAVKLDRITTVKEVFNEIRKEYNKAASQ